MRVIDSREPAEVKRLFLEEGFEEQSLSSGDFRFSAFGEKIVGIERKEDSDLLASLRVDKPGGSCRLERELWRLKAEVDYPLLLLGGTYFASKEGYLLTGSLYAGKRNRRLFTSVQNMLLSIELNGTIVVPLPVPSTSQLVRSVLAIEEYFLKPVHHFGLPKLVRDKRVELLASVIGISRRHAQALIRQYGMGTFLTASKVDLLDVANIGKIRAERIIQWREKFLK